MIILFEKGFNMILKNVFLAIAVAGTIVSASSLKGQNQFTPGEERYRFYVKFKPELGTDLVSGIPEFSRAGNSRATSVLDKISGLRFNHLVNFTPEEKQAIRSGRASRSVSGYDRTQYSGLVELQGASLMPKESLMKLANELELLEQVEYCELAPLTPPTPPSMDHEIRWNPPVTTQSWVDKQFYLYGVDKTNNNISGIYADWAWDQGITGQGVQIADVEWGWDYLHEEFNDPKRFIDVITTTNHTYDDHGTAVLGEMMATKNSFGVTGAVYGADKFYGFSEITKGRPAAILAAIDSLKKGDVLVYEMQTGGQNNEFVPADFTQSVWDVTKTATDKGIIVVAAAGNGNQNLDGSFYSAYRARGDNGSIIVGAGTKIGRDKASFSTYGSRVDVCGIGDWSIYTTGYTDLYNGGAHANYTKSFSGTSSSTPIVAAAAVAIQSYAKTKLGKIVSPKDMRALLVATGTAQGTGGKIGPLPNIQAAVTKLIADSGAVVSTQYDIVVNSGTGDGKYAVGTKVTITADTPAAGKAFDRWTGDAHLLADSTKSTTTLTVGTKAASVTALYKSAVVLDTSKLSVNLLEHSGWESGADEYGSKSVIDTVTKAKKVAGTFTTVADDVAAEKYSWAKMTSYLAKAFTGATLFKVTYTSDKPVTMVLEQTGLSEAGTAYGFELPAGTNRTEYLTLDQFKQPSWITTAQKAPLDLSQVKSIGFEAVSKNTTTAIAITELKAQNYVVDPVGVVSHTSKFSALQLAGISAGNLNLQIPTAGTYAIAMYSLNGRQLFRETRSLSAGSVAVTTGITNSGIYLISVEGAGFSAMFKGAVR